MGMNATQPTNQTDNTPARESSTEALADQIQHLIVAVEHLLRSAPGPMSELALIKSLQAPPWSLIGDVSYGDPQRLFPVHFLLFHSLYRLRDKLSEQGEQLCISPLAIQLEPQTVVAGAGVPDITDALREFYLDLEQYRLSDASIQKMMDDFWAGRWGQPNASEDLARAAEILGLDTIPEQFSSVKEKFRRAVMQAHPDRGGDTRKIQELNEAFALFRAHFRKVNQS
ncbi:DNA-J related protein [Marinobacter zhejiangensis]|uniref:DNA-J related protein n=2 Tax=Marinobacter zhejiangensis TaxID=488535 RepID=A0A1I4RG44_9GAMM|nr:DNA-J related protein [Marinobacter zhejiangensis]